MKEGSVCRLGKSFLVLLVLFSTFPFPAYAAWWGWNNGGMGWRPGWPVQTFPPFQSQLTPADTFFRSVTENYERSYLSPGQPPSRRPLAPAIDTRHPTLPPR
jgi:hypothetical protein